MEEVTPSVVAIQAQTRFGDSSGTGVILESNGLILTNQHVIDGARTITVALTDDRVFEATVIGENKSADIAVIKIEAEGLQTAVLGDSETLRVGEDVIAIGHALGLAGGPTVSKGVVSALGRTVAQGGDQLTDLIQTDAAINPGNSGGPLLNAEGLVIGINTARLNSGEGIGFAIEINTASSIVQTLIQESRLPPGDLGIAESVDITPALALILGLRVSRGVGVIALAPGGAAANGGILVDDIIVEMDGDVIVDGTDVSRFLRRHRAGASVEITFLRGNLFFRARVVLDEQSQ
ncbi:MAG: trypsin-like peptidase domain-containing protein [Chloroflexi bacterium]|nr:trypsin-like peptidase domain-containing protein [Chloroflexota bacterium]